MKRPVLLLVALFVAMPLLGHAQTGLLSQTETDAVVKKFQKAYADAFNRRDTAALGALLTENATLQNEWGDVTQGREKIQTVMTRMLTFLKEGVTLKDTAIVSQCVAPTVIVSQGVSRRAVGNAEPAQMFFMRVLVLQDGKWKMAATQVSRPSTVPKPAMSPPPKPYSG